MNRRFETYEVKTGFLLMLFVDNRPLTSLTGAVERELTTIGHAWVAAEFRLFRGPECAKNIYHAHHLPDGWNGIERRKACRPACRID